MFNAVNNLRDICKTSVCLLDEFWINEIVQQSPLFAFWPIRCRHAVLQPDGETAQREHWTQVFLFAAWR